MTTTVFRQCWSCRAQTPDNLTNCVLCNAPRAEHPELMELTHLLGKASNLLQAIADANPPDDMRRMQSIVRAAGHLSATRGELSDVEADRYPPTELPRIARAFSDLAKVSAQQADAQIRAWERKPILTVHENEALVLFREGRAAFTRAAATFEEIRKRFRMVVVK